MAQPPPATVPSRRRLPGNFGLRVPGFLVALVIGIPAQFLSEHYGAPARDRGGRNEI